MTNQQKTHCKKNHEFTIENTRITKTGARVCRTCSKLYNAEKRKLDPNKYKESSRLYRIRSSDKTKHIWIKANLKKYGLTIDSYNDLLESQKFVCKICKKSCSTGKKLAVDHDHLTGKIRGLLCARCNRGIGLFKENIEILENSISYLKEQN